MSACHGKEHEHFWWTTECCQGSEEGNQEQSIREEWKYVYIYN